MKSDAMISMQQVHGERPIAFRWQLAQPLALLASAALGAYSGWTFRYGNLSLAWLLFIFGFVWVLLISTGLGLWLSFRSRLARGDWRAGLHIGFASAFPLATLYLAAVALLTAPIALVSVPLAGGGQALARPDYLRHFPVLYFCSLVVGLLSGPLFAAWSPWRAGAGERDAHAHA